MKLTVVTAKQSTSVNLNVLFNCTQMNTIDLLEIAIVSRMKLWNTVGKQITTLSEIRRKLSIGKADWFLGKLMKPDIFSRILITLTNFPTCFLKYGFLIYGSSYLFIYFTSVDSNQWNLGKLITFASVKLYCLIMLICPMTLISHIAQLLLICLIVSVQVHIFLLNMPDIINYIARWWDKYLLKRSLIKYACSWRDLNLLGLTIILSSENYSIAFQDSASSFPTSNDFANDDNYYHQQIYVQTLLWCKRKNHFRTH